MKRYINSLDSIHPAWPYDIGFDGKSKQDTKNLYCKAEPNKETVETCINQQLQLQSITEIWKKSSKNFTLKMKIHWYYCDICAIINKV